VTEHGQAWIACSHVGEQADQCLALRLVRPVDRLAADLDGEQAAVDPAAHDRVAEGRPVDDAGAVGAGVRRVVGGPQLVGVDRARDPVPAEHLHDLAGLQDHEVDRHAAQRVVGEVVDVGLGA
jgi:hypothetical protein